MTRLEKLQELLPAIRDEREAFPTIYLETGDESCPDVWALGLGANEGDVLIYEIYTLAEDEHGAEGVAAVGFMRNDIKQRVLTIDGTDISWSYSVDKHEVILAAMRHVLSQMAG